MRRRRAPVAEPPRAALVRCAIYTRKSTEEGLEQEFNTLDAQRESAEAYVRSQQGEGWVVLPEHYDDGGFSGANMERPALRRLLADVEAGLVDAVLVYKLDRLSRSLLDFTRMMEVFDARKVAFVSVTQKFDTSTSMGRLMLHILLSFAQFEREIISERTRDKMAAAKRKGKWVGGMPVLGYDVDPNARRLLVNEAEAARVREIFALYLREESLTRTVVDLNDRGWTTKSWVTRKGHERGGGRFTKPNLFALLTNALYTGKVPYKGVLYPGEHGRIVDDEVWGRAQELLRHNGRTGGRSVRNKHGALLKEILRCGPCDAAMVHTYTVKNGKRYRYYVCLRAQKQGWVSCPTKAVPALEVERFVVEQIRVIGQDEDLAAAIAEEARERVRNRRGEAEAEAAVAERELRRVQKDLRKLLAGGGRGDVATDRLADLHAQQEAAERGLSEARERLAEVAREEVDEADLRAALSLFDPVWDALFPREQSRVLRLLLERVGYDGGAGSLAITFRPTGIRALAQELAAGART